MPPADLAESPTRASEQLLLLCCLGDVMVAMASPFLSAESTSLPLVRNYPIVKLSAHWIKKRLLSRPIAAGLLCVVLYSPGTVDAQAGDAVRGQALLGARGCLECHGSTQEASARARSLAIPLSGRFSPAIFAAVIWNHVDVASDRAHEDAVLQLSEREARDIYAYFHSLRQAGPTGDAGRGRTIFMKQCASCHDSSEAEPRTASPSSRWKPISEIADWAESMWNHAPAMLPAMQEVGDRWPRLELQQAADLVAYLGSMTAPAPKPTARRGSAALRGKRAFESLGCSQCHSFGPSGYAKIDLFRAIRREPVAAGLAVATLNQWPEMSRAAAARNAVLPQMRQGEMQAILAFLSEQAMKSAPGNRVRGARVFEMKGCLGCHGIPRTGAPELKGQGRRHSVFGFAGAVWGHAARARASVAHVPERQDLVARDVSDLVAFLNGE